MRSRDTIIGSSARVDRLQLEVLLDIREYLEKQAKVLKPKKRSRKDAKQANQENMPKLRGSPEG